MASGDRFYELELRHRPAFWGDIGNLLKIEGLVIGGEGAQAVLMLPGNSLFEGKCAPPVFVLTPEEWSEWLRQSDQPELLMPDKAFHRKVRYEISGVTQQKVWAADGFKCCYCGARMGLAPLTIDHWQPLETGGKNDTSNFLSACKKDNKSKGSMDPRDWCADRKLDYDFFVEYLKTRKLP
jgi:HNH endonuclease